MIRHIVTGYLIFTSFYREYGVRTKKSQSGLVSAMAIVMEEEINGIILFISRFFKFTKCLIAFLRIYINLLPIKNKLS